MVYMIKPPKKRHFLMKMTSGIMDPFHALKEKGVRHPSLEEA
jgi:hypothetical protein